MTSLSDVFGLVLILGLPITLLFLIVVQQILGSILSKEYDQTYFKSPYFTSAEIEIYRSWPLSLLRYATYIVFTGFPKLLQRRRFKGLASPGTQRPILKFICQLWLVSLVICILLLPIIVLLMFVLI